PDRPGHARRRRLGAVPGPSRAHAPGRRDARPAHARAARHRLHRPAVGRGASCPDRARRGARGPRRGRRDGADRPAHRGDRGPAAPVPRRGAVVARAPGTWRGGGEITFTAPQARASCRRPRGSVMRRTRIRRALLVVVAVALVGISFEVTRTVATRQARTTKDLGPDFVADAAQHILNFKRTKTERGRMVWEITA